MTRILTATLAAAAALAVAGCGSGGAQDAGPVPTSPGATQPAPTDSAPPETTTEETETGGPTTTESAPVTCDPETGGDRGVFTTLTDVRVGAHDGFDRVVFEFTAPAPDPGGKPGIPYFEIRQAEPPFTEDPSDKPVAVAGDAFARIVMQGATGYDFDGDPTYGGPTRLTPGFGTLTELVEAGDFEATMTWILGLSRATCWDIRELHNPDRLVIDFHHV